MEYEKKKKEMDIECRTFVTSMTINIKIFEPNKIKINGNSYKNILIYHIGYMIKVVSYTTNNINLL